MKRFLLSVVLATSLAFTSCQFDDSDIWDTLNEYGESIRDHEQRISALEELCKQMNTNIEALQTIVAALEKRDYVTNVSEVRSNGEVIGYTISFAYSDTITIYYGKDGKDGENGADGKDGYTPQIGVMKDTDGIYYWTLDGEWLLDAKGNKIKAVGTDGADGKDGQDGADGKDGQDGANGTDGQDGQDGTNGSDGKDGVTPQLKIENDYWYVSYDNGATWVQLGKATGEDGKDGQDGNDGADGSDGAAGEDGDSIFKSVTQDDEYVYFILADGTMITLPKHDKENIQFEDLQVKAICCKNWDTNFDGELSYAEAAAVETIGTKFKGNTNIVAFTELKYFTSIVEIPNSAFMDCSSLWKIVIPCEVSNIASSSFMNCTSLTTIIFDTTKIERISGGFDEDVCYGAFANCSELRSIVIPKSVTIIESAAFKGCSKLDSVKFENESLLTEIQGGFYKSYHYGAFADCGVLESITFPANLKVIGAAAFKNCQNLQNVIFDGESQLTEIGGGWVNGESYCYYYPHGAFQNCTSLLSITIPANCKLIKHAAFYGCSNLSVVEFEKGSKLETIKGAYYKHNILGYIGAFAHCTNLTSIVLPSNLNEIGTHSFYGCTNLSSIYCSAIIPPAIKTEGYSSGSATPYSPFEEIASGAKIYVPATSYDTYVSANYWSSYKSMIVGYNFE